MTLFVIACFGIIAVVAAGAYLATSNLNRAIDALSSLKSDLRPKEPQ